MGIQHEGWCSVSLIAMHGGVMALGAPSFSTFWNPADSGPGISLSNGNSTVLRTTVGWSSIRANLAKNSGKWAFEVTQDAFGSGGSLIVGLATSGASLTTYVGANAFGWSFQPSATPQPFTYANGAATSVPGYPNIAVAQKVLALVDIDAGKAWMRTTGASGYARGGDPVAGTSPTFTFTPGATVYPAVSGNGSPQQSTTNFGGSAFSMSIPAGFNPGWY